MDREKLWEEPTRFSSRDFKAEQRSDLRLWSNHELPISKASQYLTNGVVYCQFSTAVARYDSLDVLS